MANVRPGTKSAAAIAVMEKHSDKPMEEVIPHIATAAGLDMAKARHYYILFVRKQLAPGVVPAKAKAAPAPKAAKPAGPEKPAAPAKTPEEIADIKAKNKAKLAEVLAKNAAKAKNAPKKAAKPKAETETSDPDALFDSPESLSVDEVTHMV